MADSELAQIQDFLRRGENLSAADLGTKTIGAEIGEADPELIWMSALALARCGATDRSTELLEAAHFQDRSGIPDKLGEDIAALSARLAKDAALNGKEIMRVIPNAGPN